MPLSKFSGAWGAAILSMLLPFGTRSSFSGMAHVRGPLIFT